MTFGSGHLATGVGVLILDGFLVRGGTAVMHSSEASNTTLQFIIHIAQVDLKMALYTLPGFEDGLGCAESFSKDGDTGVDCEWVPPLLSVAVGIAHLLVLGNTVPRWSTSGAPCCLRCAMPALFK